MLFRSRQERSRPLLEIIRTEMKATQLAVLPASEQELEAHERVLTELDKASRSSTVWRVHGGGELRG